MRVVLLGTAAGGGFPQWNCACALCARARRGDPAVAPRTQCSAAVSADGERWLLLEASPDLPAQVARTPALHPRPDPGGAPRHTPIAAVLPTSGEIDCTAGLLSLRERQAFTLLAAAPVLDMLAANPMFDALDPALVPRRTLLPDAPADVAGMAVEVFPVPAKPPLYLEGRRADDPEQAVGVAVSAGGRRVCFVPACADVTAAVAARVAGCDLLLFDGTVWRDDDIAAAGAGWKTGRRMGHQPLDGTDGSLAALKDVPVRRRVLVHLNNTNPLLDDASPQRAILRAAGWEVGRDGEEIAP